MIRTMTYTTAAIVFLPIAVILLLLGINAIAPKHKKGLWLKIAVWVNSSLALLLGFTLSNSEAVAKDDDMVMCYSMAVIDATKIPSEFEQSDDWQALESSLITLEYYISAGKINHYAESLIEPMLVNIENLRTQKLISSDDAELLKAYAWSRDKTYNTTVCGVKCYKPKPIDSGKPQTRQEIVDTIDELRFIYAQGRVQEDTYDTTLATLEEKLKLYTGKEDNVVLRQLLLDVADGTEGAYFDD